MEFLCCGFDLFLLRCFLHNFMFLSFYRKTESREQLWCWAPSWVPSHCQVCLNVIRFASLASCHLQLPQAAGIQMAKFLQAEILFFFFSFSLFLLFEDYLSIKLFVPHWKTDIQWSHGGTTYDSEYRNNQCWSLDTRYNAWHGIPHWTEKGFSAYIHILMYC